MGVDDTKIVFEPTLARGLDYYTGTIIELEIPDYTAGSLGGGGRYDNLLGLFMEESIPAVGFAFGFDRLMDAMEKKGLFPTKLSGAKILMTIFNTELANKSAEAASMLRDKDIPTEIWLDAESNMEKQLKYADRKKIPFVAIIGPNEAKNNTVTLKNLNTREQKEIPLTDLPDAITD